MNNDLRALCKSIIDVDDLRCSIKKLTENDTEVYRLVMQMQDIQDAQLDNPIMVQYCETRYCEKTRGMTDEQVIKLCRDIGWFVEEVVRYPDTPTGVYKFRWYSGGGHNGGTLYGTYINTNEVSFLEGVRKSLRDLLAQDAAFQERLLSVSDPMLVQYSAVAATAARITLGLLDAEGIEE